jgi:hypothetical protein
VTTHAASTPSIAVVCSRATWKDEDLEDAEMQFKVPSLITVQDFLNDYLNPRMRRFRTPELEVVASAKKDVLLDSNQTLAQLYTLHPSYDDTLYLEYFIKLSAWERFCHNYIWSSSRMRLLYATSIYAIVQTLGTKYISNEHLKRAQIFIMRETNTSYMLENS